MMEKKKKGEALNAILDLSTQLICETVGGKMSLNAAKILIPNGTILTKIGAYLIGSGIGDFAASYTTKAIDDGFEKWYEITNSKETEPEVETVKEVEAE